MPRVTHVKKAQQPNPVVTAEDIAAAKAPNATEEDKARASYYWWKFRYGGKRFSKSYPKPSQLTQSNYLGTLYSVQENFSLEGCESIEDIKGVLEDASQEISSAGEEARDSFDNMPEGLQQGETGMLLESRADACENASSELSCWEPDDDSADIEDLREEASSVFDDHINECLDACG